MITPIAPFSAAFFNLFFECNLPAFYKCNLSADIDVCVILGTADVGNGNVFEYSLFLISENLEKVVLAAAHSIGKRVSSDYPATVQLNINLGKTISRTYRQRSFVRSGRGNHAVVRIVHRGEWLKRVAEPPSRSVVTRRAAKRKPRSFRKGKNLRYEFSAFAHYFGKSAGAPERKIRHVHAEYYAVFYCSINIRIVRAARIIAEYSHNGKLSVVSCALYNLVVTHCNARNVRSVMVPVVHSVDTIGVINDIAVGVIKAEWNLRAVINVFSNNVAFGIVDKAA